MNRFEQCLAITLAHEGGWSDHKSDPGGATQKGVTIGVFAAHKGRKVTKAELRAISDADLRAIYRRRYWDVVKADELPIGVDLVVFDAAVNSGPAQSAKWLQRAVGAKDDGKIGAETIEAVRRASPVNVINNACERRLSMLRGLKTWPTFGRGWQRRVDEVRAAALAVAAHPVTPKPVAVSEPPQSERQSWGAWLIAAIFGGRK